METKLEKARKKVLLCEKKLSLAKEEVINIIKESHITCKKCKFKMQVDKITAYEEMWYIEPHGCTGGDYWNNSTDRYIKCLNSECKRVNRFFGEGDKDVLKLLQKPYVKELISVYGEDALDDILHTRNRNWVQ